MQKRFPLLVIFLTVFIDLLGFGIIIPILPTLAVDLYGSENALAVAALYSVMNFVFAPFWGALSDRFGRRPIILISILITAGANLFFGFITTFWMLLIQRSLSGIGSANISAANAYIADISDAKNRAKNMGLVGAAFGLGFIFGPTIGGYFKTHFGLFGVGMVSGGLSILNLLLALFFLPESIKEKNKELKLDLDPITPILKAMKDPLIKRLFGLNVLFITAFSLMQITAAVLWEQHYHLNEKEIGYVFSFIGLSSAFVQGVLVGALSKRFDPKVLILMGLVLMSLALIIMPFMSNIYWELIPLALLALGNGCITPSILTLLSMAAEPREQGKIMGLNQSFGSLGRVAGPVLGGFLYQLHYTIPYLAGAFISLLCLSFIWFNNQKAKT